MERTTPGERPLKRLTPEAVAFYQAHGYYAPVPALPAAEVAELRRKLEAHETAHGHLRGPLRHKTHLLFTWLDGLIRHPAILDAVEDLIGPNILAWGTSFFIKEARDPSYVSWHQDSTYWGLEPAEIVTAWVALSESTAENGAMRVIPDSHLLEQVPHRDTFAAGNLLSRGQEIAVEVEEARAHMLELRPGEMSLHHVRLIHGSDPNPSDSRRIGFAIRYLPTHVRQVAGTHDSATLVRGVDAFHHFAPEQRPEADFSPAALAFHTQITGAHQEILMRGTGRTAAA
ncbi:phytanoyl-CoA dioxygenase family protein [Roseomonas hellenica]|uniref:Phytanoyl-CoA dioxygenase family protein n=1 Tax=Plastoroseomonas hellenica TaxID=2687306 RepID=A0ABS5ERP4_9PROT|nr:phytanoyl-CoA dioxygenase family protein [Plastoroseomonas hellenica]MBR0662968.1 phytanoyl-CoA dioxygenase family protein [Plastoroseomonas hellenica]